VDREFFYPGGRVNKEMHDEILPLYSATVWFHNNIVYKYTIIILYDNVVNRCTYPNSMAMSHTKTDDNLVSTIY